MKYLASALMLLLISTGCQQQPPATAEDVSATGAIWVAQPFSGGRQCEEDDYRPPDTRALLEAQNISVLETATQPLPVCLACGICPSYAARHYARIPVGQADAAAALGFKKHMPPPSRPGRESPPSPE